MRNPCAGSSGVGEVMLTPGIGPATVGPSGCSVLVISQAAALRATSTPEHAWRIFRDMPRSPRTEETRRSFLFRLYRRNWETAVGGWLGSGRSAVEQEDSTCAIACQ